ncbi:hypothetical protein VYU27_003959 [Nannochloropsis oceanica]
MRALSSAAAAVRAIPALETSTIIKKLLIANRGEIACRIIRTARKMGIKTVAVYSDADARAQFVQMADEAHWIGPSPTRESYLVKEKILAVAQRAGAQALHPGYGFLSENPDFAEMCQAAGVLFVGPSVSALRAMGSKAAAKQIMTDAGVPVTPSYYGEDQDDARLVAEAEKVGYPVMIKAVTGGGGKGMRRVLSASDFLPALEACRREALKSFGRDRMLIEKYLVDPRHIELQVFGDSHGNAVHLYERDCSVQRRHQKVLEESPAPGLDRGMREEMGRAAVLAAKAVGYTGAGTVEFLVDPVTEAFYFCEMNTRLQVEHCVTEMVTGVDLVEWQLRVAAGEPLPVVKQEEIMTKGHAIEARIYAENPAKGFLPATGFLKRLRTPKAEEGGVRVETGVVEGDEVSMFYDPMIAKLLTWAPTRGEALRKMKGALQEYQIAGLPNNLEFLERCVGHPAFARGAVTTGFLVEHERDVSIPPPSPPSNHLVALAAHALVEGREGGTRGGSPWVGGAWRGLSGERSLPLTMVMEGLEEVPLVLRVNVSPPNEEKREEGVVVSVKTPDGEVHRVVGRHGKNSSSSSSSNDDEREATIDGSVTYKYHAWIKDGGPRDGAAIQLWLRSGGLVDDPLSRLAFSLSVPAIALGKESGGSIHPKVIAPMPGKVVKVLVKDGEEVKKGQALMILEAMKMEHVIAAPRDATVEAVARGVGDVVQEGVALISLQAV